MLLDKFVLDRLNLPLNQVILRLNFTKFVLNSSILLLTVALGLLNFGGLLAYLFFHFGNTVNFMLENPLKGGPIEVAQIVFSEFVCKLFELIHR